MATEWFCEGCQRRLSPHELTRVGIGVHHYDRDKDTNKDGLLNCGLVKVREIVEQPQQAEGG